MGKVIDFSQYKEELASRNNSLSAFLRAKGADDDLAHFGETLEKELLNHISGAGQYSFPITFPETLSDQDRGRIVGEIRSGIDEIRNKLQGVVKDLAIRAWVAEMKVYQYERIHRQ